LHERHPVETEDVDRYAASLRIGPNGTIFEILQLAFGVVTARIEE
jgi:hypothetical protein